MNYRQNKQQSKAEAIVLAKQILHNNIDYIEGCRKIKSLLYEIYEDPLVEGFGIFIVIDSDTDHLPSNTEKQNWNADALKKKHKEIEDAYQFYKKDLMEGCEKLIAEFKKGL